MVFTTNRTTWQHCRARNTKCTKPRAPAQPINCNIIQHKDTMIPYMNQTRHPLNNQVLTIFFPFATIPGTPHYSEFSDKYYTQCDRWSFSLYFITNILFSTFFPPFSHPLSTTQPIQSTTQPLSLQTNPLPFFSHSPYSPSLYPKPATKHYLREFTNILYSLVNNRS